MASNFEDFWTLVGRYHATPATLEDGQPCELLVDDKCRLIISGRHLEDDGHTSGDPGIFALAVRNDNNATLTDADLDYSAIAVDEFGRLKVIADLSVDFDYVYDEDSVHTNEDPGAFQLSIRLDDISADNSANLAGTDGDYQGFFTNDKGELYVHDTDVLAQLVDITTNGVEQKMKGTESFNSADDLADGEDGLVGVPSAAAFTNLVCIDVDASETLCLYGWQYDMDRNGVGRLVSIIDDGTGVAASGTATVVDYTLLSGAILTIGGVAITEGVEWTAATDNDTTAASLASAANAVLGVNASSALAVVTISSPQEGTAGNAITLVTSDGTNLPVSGATLSGGVDAVITEIKILKTRLNSSAMPGVAEHWAESARIEIAGATNKKVCVQARKRGKPAAGVSCASGSMHARLVV